MPLDCVTIQLERCITKLFWQGASPLDSSLEVDSSLKPMSFDRITVRSLSMTICKPSPSSPLSRSSFPAWHQKLFSPPLNRQFFFSSFVVPDTYRWSRSYCGWLGLGWHNPCIPKKKIFLKKKHPPHVLPLELICWRWLASGSYRRQRCQGIESGSGKYRIRGMQWIAQRAKQAYQVFCGPAGVHHVSNSGTIWGLESVPHGGLSWVGVSVASKTIFTV